MWHDDKYMAEKVLTSESFDYSSIDSLKHFHGTHPEVMTLRIEAMDWKFEVDPTKKNFGLKASVLYFIEKMFGWRVGEYKNYQLIR